MRNLHRLSTKIELTDKQKAHIWYADRQVKSENIYVEYDGAVGYTRRGTYISWWFDGINDSAVQNMWARAHKPEPSLKNVKFQKRRAGEYEKST